MRWATSIAPPKPLPSDTAQLWPIYRTVLPLSGKAKTLSYHKKDSSHHQALNHASLFPFQPNPASEPQYSKTAPFETTLKEKFFFFCLCVLKEQTLVPLRGQTNTAVLTPFHAVPILTSSAPSCFSYDTLSVLSLRDPEPPLLRRWSCLLRSLWLASWRGTSVERSFVRSSRTLDSLTASIAFKLRLQKKIE